jgi:uncharacterized phage protein (TIGR02218 family)
MRQLSETFAAGLAAGETSLCACWRLERRDGAVFGATDHDRPVAFDDVTYSPVAGLAGASFESDASLAPGRAVAEGVLDAEFITEADLAAGLWDGARVDVWRVDWKASEHRVRVWSGRLSEVKQAGQAFTAELVSLKADLERPVGRVYARACDAEVGDARCKVDLGGDGFHGGGEVTAVIGPVRIRASGLSDFDDGWFAGGVVHWTTGANAGLSSRVVRQTAGDAAGIALAGAPRFVVEVGDTFVITAGCDKAFATCGAKFANQENFRGFPHMPGNDAVLSGPASDTPNDGRRRA